MKKNLDYIDKSIKNIFIVNYKAGNGNVNKVLNNYAYSLGTVKEIINNPYCSTNIGDITLLVAANGKYYGNGVPINPNYDLNDGKLEFYYAERLRRLQILKLFLKVYKEEHQNDKLVNYFQNNKYSISSDVKLNCNVDGEIIRDNEFEFNILPEYVNINADIPVYIKQYIKKNKL